MSGATRETTAPSKREQELAQRIDALERRNRALEMVATENEQLKSSFEHLNARMQLSHRLAKLLFWECDREC